MIGRSLFIGVENGERSSNFPPRRKIFTIKIIIE